MLVSKVPVDRNEQKVKYNLKNIHVAELAETVEDGVTTFSYETPKAIPGAVSLSLDAEGDSSPFYADGIVYFRTGSNNGYSGDLEMLLIPKWFRTEILWEKLDTKGVLVEKSDLTETEKFALLVEFDGDVKAIHHVLYCRAGHLHPHHPRGGGGLHRAGGAAVFGLLLPQDVQRVHKILCPHLYPDHPV